MRPGQDPVARGPGALPRLPPAFLTGPTPSIARALLGQFLVAGAPGDRRVARLVETEAYLRGDPASHAFRGPTPRNRSMFGPVGRWYVYRIHQVHCVNVVTGPGEAVLLRAAEPRTPGLGDLSGPGRLARGFGFDRADDGTSVRSGRVQLRAGPAPTEPVRVGPRVGISKARERPLRYYLAGVREVSRPRG